MAGYTALGEFILKYDELRGRAFPGRGAPGSAELVRGRRESGALGSRRAGSALSECNVGCPLDTFSIGTAAFYCTTPASDRRGIEVDPALIEANNEFEVLKSTANRPTGGSLLRRSRWREDLVDSDQVRARRFPVIRARRNGPGNRYPQLLAANRPISVFRLSASGRSKTDRDRSPKP